MKNYLKALFDVFKNYHFYSIPVLMNEMIYYQRYNNAFNKFKYLNSDFLSEKPILAAVTGDFFLIVIILFYLVETINNTDLSKIQDSILIFISVGLLVSSVIQLPVVIMTYVGWAKITDASNSFNTFFSIVRNASFWAYCVMYVIFAYGFYRAKRPQFVKNIKLG